MELILGYRLFDIPLPNQVALKSQTYKVWGKRLDPISNSGNIELSEESVKHVS